MTTDKQVADNLTTQGKTISQEEAPPQTIIPRVSNAYARFAEECKGIQFNVGEPIIPPAVDGGAEGILRPGKFASAKIVPDSIRESIIPTNFDGDGPGEEDGPWAKGWEDRAGGPTIIRDVERQQLVNAEVRRQTVQAEAMVNLAVGVVAAKMSTHGFKFTRDANGKPDKFRIAVSPQELLDFQRLYTVTQEIQPDGGFIISISPKEG